LKNPRPRYPRLALKEGWEGKVILRIKVLPNGKVGGVTVQQSAGRTVLDEAALEVAQNWTFVPATQGGKPIAGWVLVPVEFHTN
jgi:protein TonB